LKNSIKYTHSHADHLNRAKLVLIMEIGKKCGVLDCSLKVPPSHLNS